MELWVKVLGVHVERFDNVWLGVACDDHRVYATTFASDEDKAVKSLLESIPFGVEFQQSAKASPFARKVLDVLRDYFDGKGDGFGFELAMEHMTPYTQRVLRVASKIPLGYVASYGAVAKAAGGKGARAVGNCMHRNPFAPVVPCHRVVSSMMGLGGYGGGLDVKLAFLRREDQGFAGSREVKVDGGKLLVHPVREVLKRFAVDKR